MKKIFTVFLITLVTLSFVFAEAQTEKQPTPIEEKIPVTDEVIEPTVTRPEQIVIYAQVPEDWKFPCVWAWSEAGENAFEAWPGNTMIKDSGNPGWYYIYLPGFVDSVIINANDGSVQTSDYAVNGKNAWLTINSPDTVSVSFDSLTEGLTPEYNERFMVYANVPNSWKNPCIWAWENKTGKNAFSTWPGSEMKANKNGYYSFAIPTYCDSIVINANEGTIQTKDSKGIDPAPVWITVAEDGTTQVSFNDPTIVAVADITVHVIVPTDWSNPCVWAWSDPDGTNAYSNWPGEPLEKIGENEYELKTPGWINSVIINANDGSIQTSDIRVDSGKDLYLTVEGPDTFTLNY